MPVQATEAQQPALTEKNLNTVSHTGKQDAESTVGDEAKPIIVKLRNTTHEQESPASKHSALNCKPAEELTNGAREADARVAPLCPASKTAAVDMGERHRSQGTLQTRRRPEEGESAGLSKNVPEKPISYVFVKMPEAIRERIRTHKLGSSGTLGHPPEQQHVDYSAVHPVREEVGGNEAGMDNAVRSGKEVRKDGMKGKCCVVM